MISHFSEIYLRDLQALRLEVSSFIDEALLWKTLPGTSNSAGHLCLHLLGNLNHFIGAGLGKTGYIRQRDLEFTAEPTSQQALLKQIDECATMLTLVFSALRNEDLKKEFPLPWREGLHFNTHFMLTQLAVHFNYHLGQINYHRRFFTA